MKIQVDSREPEQIFEKLNKKEIEYEKKLLPVGDFVFNDIVVERKEMNDFYQSIISNRIFEQVTQMKANYEKVYVMISGKIVDLFNFYHTPNYGIFQIVYGAIASLCEKYDIKVLRVENDNELINQMMKIFQKSTEPKTVYAKRLGINSEDVYLSMLSCIPGISYQKAKLILSQYKFCDLIKIEKEELLKIKGIGNVLAGNIKAYLS